MATITASPLIRLHTNDNVLAAREPIALGQSLPELGLRVRAQVPAGHKIAAEPITERGPMFGAKPVPSIKLASNTPMYERLKGDMDISCGTVVDGKATVDQLGQTIFDEILRVASGGEDQERGTGAGGQRVRALATGHRHLRQRAGAPARHRAAAPAHRAAL